MSIDLAPPIPLPKVTLVETDGEKLESPWHVAAISLLIELLTYWWRDRHDFYVGGNMFMYYSEEQARNKEYRGPDFFFVNDVNRHPPRPYWAVWLEGGRYPDLIIELLSPPTAHIDRTVKKKLYEKVFRTAEYYCYDPDTHQLEGWRLSAKHRYRAIKPGKNGWFWSEQLGMWLGNWKGIFQGMEEIWLRLYDKDGQLIPLEAEAERAKLLAAEAELASLRAKLEELEGKK